MPAITAREYQDRFFSRNPGLRQPLELMKAVPNASFFVKDLQRRYVMANAFHLGIYDQSYFTKRFRKATGMTPLAYRRYFRRNQRTD